MTLSVNAEQAGSTPLDWLKWLFVLLLIAAMVVGNFYVTDQSVSLRIAGNLLAGIIVLSIASFTGKGKRFWAFAKDARVELRKVVWPTRQETIQSTIMIVVVVIIMALFLWGIDSFLLWALGFITGQRG